MLHIIYISTRLNNESVEPNLLDLSSTLNFLITKFTRRNIYPTYLTSINTINNLDRSEATFNGRYKKILPNRKSNFRAMMKIIRWINKIRSINAIIVLSLCCYRQEKLIQVTWATSLILLNRLCIRGFSIISEYIMYVQFRYCDRAMCPYHGD